MDKNSDWWQQVNRKSTCTVMAMDRLVKMCSSRGDQIPLVLDKYLLPLIRFGAKTATIRVSSHIYHHWTLLGPALEWDVAPKR